MDNIFKKGDGVFNITLGWLTVTNLQQIKNNSLGTMVPVTKDGWSDFEYMPEKELSFTEYTLNGFSQERPINYDEWVGKWCKFWDNANKKWLYFSKFKHKSDSGYVAEDGDEFDNCQPLTEEQIKILGL